MRLLLDLRAPAAKSALNLHNKRGSDARPELVSPHSAARNKAAASLPFTRRAVATQHSPPPYSGRAGVRRARPPRARPFVNLSRPPRASPSTHAATPHRHSLRPPSQACHLMSAGRPAPIPKLSIPFIPFPSYAPRGGRQSQEVKPHRRASAGRY